MPHQNQPNSRIDDYLDRIADRERQERRKKILLAVVGLAILAAGFTIVKNVDFSADLPYYGVNELPEGEIRSLFQDEDFQALFVHPLGKDTITSFADYLNLKAFLAEAGMTESTFTSDDGAVEEPPVENTLRVFSVDVSGSRTSGEKLRFVIEDYDPEIKYMLDFGNGFRREVGRISNYTYRRSGRFQLRLLATSETEGNSVYTKRIRISRAEQETEAPTETATPEPQASGDPIAENTEEVEPAPETATGEDEEVLASLDDLGSTTSERAEIDLNDSRSGDEGATEEIPGANDAPLLPSPEIEAAPVVTTPA
ncbi:MAG: PKD domain-containing protein, partial [Bacteroidota bacterium]